MADDIGYGDLGCYGQDRIATPNIDRMADEGIRFTDHYAGHTVCKPSRLVLRTGLHSGHTPLRGNSADFALPEGTRITARLLKQAGYVVAGVGKWAMGGPDGSGAPFKHGFDLWYGYLNQVAAHNYWPEFLWRNEQKVFLDNEVDYADSGYAEGLSGNSTKKVDYSHDLMVDEALGFIRDHTEDRFFLQLHLTIPHANNQGKPHGMEVPDFGRYKDRDWPDPEKGFAAMITRLDRDVGRIMKRLEALGLEDETIIFFTSDNGPHREGGHDHKFFDSNGPLRGMKRDLYEGGIRVPMIVRWPGKIEGGRVTSHPSAFWDFMPTACELANIEPPEDIDGISYLPTLMGTSRKQKRHERMVWASSWNNERALRAGKWKLVRPKNRSFELYNLKTDPGEQTNLADKRPELVEKLKGKLKDAMNSRTLPRMP